MRRHLLLGIFLILAFSYAVAPTAVETTARGLIIFQLEKGTCALALLHDPDMGNLPYFLYNYYWSGQPKQGQSFDIRSQCFNFLKNNPGNSGNGRDNAHWNQAMNKVKSLHNCTAVRFANEADPLAGCTIPSATTVSGAGGGPIRNYCTVDFVCTRGPTVTATTTAPLPVSTDEDRDGVLNTYDKCPNTRLGTGRVFHNRKLPGHKFNGCTMAQDSCTWRKPETYCQGNQEYCQWNRTTKRCERRTTSTIPTTTTASAAAEEESFFPVTALVVAAPAPQGSCTDSDGGQRIYVAGTTNGQNDFCYVRVSGTTGTTTQRVTQCRGENCYVDEQWCDSVRGYQATGILCAAGHGCENGACLPYDTDAQLGEERFYVKGRCYSGVYPNGIEDNCGTPNFASGEYVYDFKVVPDNAGRGSSCESDRFRCPNGCENGACLDTGKAEKGLPDLTAHLSVSPPTKKVDARKELLKNWHNLQVFLTVTNKGSVPTRMYFSQMMLKVPKGMEIVRSTGSQTAYFTLPPGGKKIRQFFIQAMEPGKWELSGVVDPENKIKELDEGNNRAGITVEVFAGS